MKKVLYGTLFCMLLAAIHACTKQQPLTPNPPTTDSATKMITGQTWVYYEYFYNFDSANTTLVWKSSRSSNTLNLAKNQVKFNIDSTYSEIDQTGTTYNGTWQFLNNETQVKVVNSQGTFISTIQKLTPTKYEWLASDGNHYGVMVPKNQTFDTTGGRMQLLTAKSWTYDEYLYNYNLTAPQLAWKTNNTNSPLNLAKNTVKYNSNGTYSETDQNGTVYNGTWQFLNNMTETATTSSLGTFYAYIYRLDSARYEWNDSLNSHHYGEMVHP